MKKLLIIIGMALLAAATTSCGNQSQTKRETGDTLRMSHARNIIMVRHKDYTEVTLANPWKRGQKLISYALVDSSHGHASVPEGMVRVGIPIKRCLLFTAAHTELARELGATNSIKGVADAQYMHQPWLKSAISKNKIVDCGNSMKPNMESIVALAPDAIFVSPYENGSYGKLEHAGIPLILLADYMETSALGRAEWMKFYGLLWGREREADRLFDDVCRSYDRISHIARETKGRPQVIAERKTGSVWYMPGGKSTVAQLYRDANADYAFKDDGHSGSLPLSFETVLEKAGQADIWLLSFNNSITREGLLDEFGGYGQLKAMREGKVYGCPVDRSRFFDEVPFRPDLLLRDMVAAFHPELHLGPLRYYQLIH